VIFLADFILFFYGCRLYQFTYVVFYKQIDT